MQQCRLFGSSEYRVNSTNKAERAGTSAVSWLPLVILPLAAAAARNRLPAWSFMWLMSFALFAGCKWLTWWTARFVSSSPWRSLAYLLLWPGMDAGSFLDDQQVP